VYSSLAGAFAAGATCCYLLINRLKTFDQPTPRAAPAHPRAAQQTTTDAGEDVKTSSLVSLYDATDPADFRQAATCLVDWIIQYRRKCRDMPVLSTVPHNYLKDMLPTSAPRSPDSWKDIFADLEAKILPGLVHWEASNRFFAYFKPHSSFPAVLGELLCAGLNVQGFDWVAAPACTELEVVVLDWLGKILHLPDKFLSASAGPGGGVIQGSAGEAAVVCLLAAVHRYCDTNSRPFMARRDNMVVYASDQTHTIIRKACRILGLRLVVVPTERVYGYSLQARALEQAIRKDLSAGLKPVCAVATPGTTSSCAFDDLTGIGLVCKKMGVWMHVDAAYGGAYACLPELQHLFRGLEQADSVCVNAHKKLLCPFDLSALFVADRHPLLQALSVDSEYLRNEHSESGAVVDYENWQLPLGRRFRALKLWFVLRRFGEEGIRDHVRRGVSLRQLVQARMAEDKRFELAAPPSLSLLCFRLAGEGDSTQQQLLQAVKQTGKCFIIHTKLSGAVVLRFACGGIEQTEADVLDAWQVISDTATAVLKL